LIQGAQTLENKLNWLKYCTPGCLSLKSSGCAGGRQFSCKDTRLMPMRTYGPFPMGNGYSVKVSGFSFTRHYAGGFLATGCGSVCDQRGASAVVSGESSGHARPIEAPCSPFTSRRQRS
jgi:hypothetical protein